MIDSFWQGVVIGAICAILFSLFILGVAIACAADGTDSNRGG